jgi:hypothetical protein
MHFINFLLDSLIVNLRERISSDILSSFTWQKDNTSPFVAMRLKHEDCFGSPIERLATRLSTWFVFKAMNRRYASFLKRNDIEVPYF